MKEIRLFLDQHGPSIELGLIVFGSFYQHQKTEREGETGCPFRDIDLIVLTETRGHTRRFIEHGGLAFDVHYYNMETLRNLVFVQKNLYWIRNLFASSLVLSKSPTATLFHQSALELRNVHPARFLTQHDYSFDRLVVENHLSKIARNPADYFNFAFYFLEIIRRIYFWKCLDLGIWPSADPRYIRLDIARRFSALEEAILRVEKEGPQGSCAVLRKLVHQELPPTNFKIRDRSLQPVPDRDRRLH